jgi:hypothetical protein
MNLMPGEKKPCPPAIGTPFGAVHCDDGWFQIEQVRFWFHVWFILSGNGLDGWSKVSRQPFGFSEVKPPKEQKQVENYFRRITYFMVFIPTTRL